MITLDLDCVMLKSDQFCHLIYFYFLALTDDIVNNFSIEFHSDPKNIFAQNVSTRFDPFDASLSRKTLQTVHHVFTHTVIAEGTDRTLFTRVPVQIFALKAFMPCIQH
jgi:hypothetical protein